MSDRTPDTDDYLSLFLQNRPMIDTRAPVEFAQGAFPNAVNLPLMSDEERARVGTCYKEQGQEAAIDLGHRLVSGKVKEQRVQAWLEFARAHPEGYLYCFRGGLRSQICQRWLSEAGCDYPRITGGYKAMRRFLLGQLESLSARQPMVLLTGGTGAAKTEFLRQLPQAVDLEGQANHLGSAFGRRPGGQPAQIDFENAVTIDLLRCHHAAPEVPVVLEDESHLIGRCLIPLPLQAAMARAPLLVLDVALEDRVEHTHTNYILRKLADWQQHLGEALGLEAFEEDLRASLARIRKRLGGARYQELSRLLDAALLAHRRGDTAKHRDWIRPLLQDYYDPMYQYQLAQKAERVLFQGPPEQVMAFLHERGAGPRQEIKAGFV